MINVLNSLEFWTKTISPVAVTTKGEKKIHFLRSLDKSIINIHAVLTDISL